MQKERKRLKKNRSEASKSFFPFSKYAVPELGNNFLLEAPLIAEVLFISVSSSPVSYLRNV